MTQIAGARRAIALSGFDLSVPSQTGPHGCEDCACSVSGSLEPRTWPPLPEVTGVSHWVRGEEIIKIQIGNGYNVLFNPVGSGGALVVNEPGLALLRRFEQPVTLAEARVSGPESEKDAQYMFDRLSR